MKITTELSIPIDVKILNKPVYHEEIQIGKITGSYIKDGKMWVTIILDSKKLKQCKKLLKILKEL